MKNYTNSPERTALYRKIEIARKQLSGMSEEDFRNMLEDRYQVRSRKNMGAAQLVNLIKHFESLGVVYTPRKGRPTLALMRQTSTGSLLKKIEALLAEKGFVEKTELPWAYAAGILKRLNSGVALAWPQAPAHLLNGVIAALTADAKRKGRFYEEYGVEHEEDPQIIASYGGRCRHG